MLNPAKLDKNAQKGAILYALNVLKAKKVVKNQKEFAALLGVTEQTISAALNNKGRSHLVIQGLAGFLKISVCRRFADLC